MPTLRHAHMQITSAWHLHVFFFPWAGYHTCSVCRCGTSTCICAFPPDNLGLFSFISTSSCLLFYPHACPSTCQALLSACLCDEQRQALFILPTTSGSAGTQMESKWKLGFQTFVLKVQILLSSSGRGHWQTLTGGTFQHIDKQNACSLGTNGEGNIETNSGKSPWLKYNCTIPCVNIIGSLQAVTFICFKGRWQLSLWIKN